MKMHMKGENFQRKLPSQQHKCKPLVRQNTTNVQEKEIFQ